LRSSSSSLYNIYVLATTCPAYHASGINTDIAQYTDLLASYEDDFVIEDLCGAYKSEFFQCRPAPAPFSNFTWLPAAIRPPPTNDTFLFAFALQGVRAYSCNVSNTAAPWTQLDSRSCLFKLDDTGVPSYISASAVFIRNPGGANQAYIGTLTPPYSAVQIVELSTAPAPSGDPQDLPWELTTAQQILRARSEPEPRGLDFTNVQYINRINTKQGNTPPNSQCTSAVNGKEIETVYSAIYYMYGANPLNP